MVHLTENLFHRRVKTKEKQVEFKHQRDQGATAETILRSPATLRTNLKKPMKVVLSQASRKKS